MKYGSFKYGEMPYGDARYPEWWDETVTVFNRYEDDATGLVTWYSKVLRHCFWKCVNNQHTANNTVADASSVTVRIPQSGRFKLPYEWNGLANKENYFTFNTGDIIISGEVSETIDEYTAGIRSADILSKYSGCCMTVQTSNVNIHSGVGLPHYHITGG